MTCSVAQFTSTQNQPRHSQPHEVSHADLKPVLSLCLSAFCVCFTLAPCGASRTRPTPASSSSSITNPNGSVCTHTWVRCTGWRPTPPTTIGVEDRFLHSCRGLPIPCAEVIAVYPTCSKSKEGSVDSRGWSVLSEGDLGSMRGDRGREERRTQEWILAEG